MIRRSLTDMLRTTLDPQVSTIVALTALGDLNGFLREQEAHLVGYAREEGFSWDDIGQALGRSPSLLARLHRSVVRR